MKICTAQQMKIVDRITIQEEGLSSIDLMERAAYTVVSQLRKDICVIDKHVILFCGAGNNGGDGLAVARILRDEDAIVFVYLQKHDTYAHDNTINQHRLKEEGIAIHYIDFDKMPDIPTDGIIIDALFGYGLSRPLSTEWTKLVNHLNNLPNTVVAIDMPSGLMADQHTDRNHPIIKADLTYTFQIPKLALLLPGNVPYMGKVTFLDLRLSITAVEQQHTAYHYTTADVLKHFLSEPSKFAHKGTFGHSLIIGGSFGKMGAVVLSSRAALRTGCGLVSAYIPRCGYTILQAAFPEAMVMTDETENTLSFAPQDLSDYTALGIGIGMGTSTEAQNFLHNLLVNIHQQSKIPALVLDADALNIVSLHPEWLPLLPTDSILTPHPKELERLIGPWENDFDKLQKTKDFANSNQSIVLIKGANTAIVFPDGQVYFNSTGNWGMATGGSGDVLTGILTSLLAQGFSSQRATILGVYLHGLAGDLAAQNIHPKSLIASDIVDYISVAWKNVEAYKKDR